MGNLTLLGQVLHEEHFRILVCISDLQNRVCGEAGERAFDPADEQERAEMQDLIHALDRVLEHHAFEEDVVFPLIRADGDAALADLLAREHTVIEPTSQRLRVLAAEILQFGPGDGRWADFREIGQVLFSQMLSHLEKEEMTIVQRFDRLLDAATDHRLALQHLSSRLLPAVAGGQGAQR